MSSNKTSIAMLNSSVLGSPGQSDTRPFVYLSSDEVNEAKALVLYDKADKIRFIHELMTSLRWTRGKTYKELCRIWDMTPACMRSYTADAHTIFKMNLGKDPDEIRGRLEAQMEHVVVSAMGNKKAVIVTVGENEQEVEYVDAPDHKAALTGLRDIANLCGLNKKKVEHKVEYEKENLVDLIAQARAEIDEYKNPILTSGEEKTDELPNIIQHELSDSPTGGAGDGSSDI